jgi:di/tricarboxylate transporter
MPGMEHIVVFATLLLALILFAWGRLRHDLVALISLFILVITGIVDAGTAFRGFGHPAVITVASVLIIGKGLEQSGLVDIVGKWVLRAGTGIVTQIFILSSMVAFASAFMNNVGALALIMPIAISLARKSGHPPSYILMPLAFASLLGGMTTLIGTPPNIIIASFRAEEVGEPFGMFDFMPVGIFLVIAGLFFITIIGWRLLPKRIVQKSDQALFDIDDYITEVQVSKESAAKGKTIREFAEISKVDMQILGLVRRNERIHAPENEFILKVNDIIIIETDVGELKELISNTGVTLVGGKKFRKDAIGSKHIAIIEAVVMADSSLVGRSVSEIKLRRRYSINLLSVARREEKIFRRLPKIIIRTGDVLLLQGRDHMLRDTIVGLGCLPLAERGLQIDYKTKIPLAITIFGAAIVAVAVGLLPAEVAFSMAAVAMVLSGVLPIKHVYTSIDWPVIILLGAMIPVGIALETSGAADRIAGILLNSGESLPVWVILTITLVVTMFLSDIINNAATVILMAPIALGVANGLNYSIDPFLMAVAIGGSSAFLTPIGHQSNTLVMAPGGYKFTDYWRMGLPLEMIIVAIAIPLLMAIFPP